MTDKICPECGAEHDQSAKFCRNCGIELSSKKDNLLPVVIENESEDNMKICPDCGSKQEKIAKFCKNCGASFSKENNNTLTCRHCGAELHSEAYCPDCGKPTGIKICPNCRQMTFNEDYCSFCGYRLNSNVRICTNCRSKIDAKANVCAHCGARVLHKNPFIAAILSFFIPGLGQLYNNQNHKGIIFITASLIFLILCFVVVGAIFLLVLWIYAIYDAFVSANAINRGEDIEDRIFQ